MEGINTGDGNFTNTVRQEDMLSARFAILFAVLNFILSMTASLGNVLILIALREVSSIYPPTKLLFRCLAITDLCVGLILQPLYATTTLGSVTQINTNILFYIDESQDSLGFVLGAVSIFTATAISVDRLMALLSGLRFRNLTTLKRVRLVISCFWAAGVSAGFVYSFYSKFVAYTASLFTAILSVGITVSAHTKIFLTLRKHHFHVQDNFQQGQRNEGGNYVLHVERYKRTVSSIAWVQLALVSCYGPFVVSVTIIKIYGLEGMTAKMVWTATRTLLYLNSSLNPILYCWKIKEIRQIAKATVNNWSPFAWANR